LPNLLLAASKAAGVTTADTIREFGAQGAESNPVSSERRLMRQFSSGRSKLQARSNIMKLGLLGISILLLSLTTTIRPSLATEPGSKECVQYGAANHCTAHWDRRDKSCKC
jgi:hypothetical protein